MTAAFRTAAGLVVILVVLTGILYPLAVTGVARLLFPAAATGSLIRKDGKVVGSRLIGQPFAGSGWFHGRPSATSPGPYHALLSGGSNLGPTNPALRDRVRDDVARLRGENPGNPAPIPLELVTTSASGLDPHLSPAAAYWQVPRVAAARGLAPSRVEALVRDHVEAPDFGFLGEARVNVLVLNLALEKLAGR